MLSLLFSKFDELCEVHNVFKVYTIGDCYVVMGFKDVKNLHRSPHVEIMNLLKFSFDMRDAIDKIQEEHEMGIGMRIGMHIGDIVAGVTGTNIVRFDIYGPDVMIANTMESEGERGKINVSKKAKKYIEESQTNDSQYTFEVNKLVSIKFRTN